MATLAPAATNLQRYNAPDGSPSSIGPQARTDMFVRKAILDAREKSVFSQMSSLKQMPKHQGKKIKQQRYFPVLDDRNINDQGIDAAGKSTTHVKTIVITVKNTGQVYYVVNKPVMGTTVTPAAAATAAEAAAILVLKNDLKVTSATNTFAAYVTAATAAGYVVDVTQPAVPVMGNLWASSKDIGTITDSMPTLTEEGGRVNRVGNTRIEIEGTIAKFGFFREYTAESENFDSDTEIEMNLSKLLVDAAYEVNEAQVQIALIQGAGVVRFGGDATSNATMTGNNVQTGTAPKANSVISYADLMRLNTTLNDNKCAKDTKFIFGSTMIDTRVIKGGRVLYVGSELEISLAKMTNFFGKPAFISIEHYGAAASASLLEGEIGAIGPFRIVVAPNMLKWSGDGATATTNQGYYETNGKFDVFPMLAVGTGSFTHIGFQSEGTSSGKFTTIHKRPGRETADRNDPYGEKGFMSTKWYFGLMVLRPEWLACLRTLAEV